MLPAPPVHASIPMFSTLLPPIEPFRSQHEVSGMSRSASLPHLPGAQPSQPTEGIKRTFSDNVLALLPDGSPRHGQSPYVPSKELLRRASTRSIGRIAVTKFTLSAEDLGSSTSNDTKESDTVEITEKSKPSTVRSVTSTFKNLARRTWITSSSRSPSPARREPKKLAKAPNALLTQKEPTTFMPEPGSTSPAVSASSLESKLTTSSGVDPLPGQNPSETKKPSRRPLSAILLVNKSETELKLVKKSSLQSLRSRSSSDRLSKPPQMKVPPIPSSLSSDRLSSVSVDNNKRRDPLWGVFRALEADFQKFQSKSSALKANVIRTSLLPFLAKHSDHPSNKTLRSEDLDRRAMILNKWWTGLLDMLNGGHNQSISGTDRPAFLEGVAGVMVRPEWRVPPYLNPRPGDTPPSIRPGMASSTSSTSLESGGSDFLIESVHHNVRNIFVQNLLSQMAFVVDKMSMRSAPASLVAFCGRACAYAFFFCPGVADVLVRLWHLSGDSLRRIFSELGVPRGSQLRASSSEVASRFPPAVRNLAINSQAALVRYLHNNVPLPLRAVYIRWYGPWISRWNGRNSDLFFAFTKHFHLLVAEILPGSCQKNTRACVPGLVLVHAQLLTVLDTTLHRQAAQHQGDMHGSGAVDDLDSPDATVAMPLTTTNAARSIAENRLVMLLRDLLAESNPDHQGLRELFAESFWDILKAATRKVSLYNHDACFVLCDLMEEVLTIMSRYHRSHPETEVLDWAFWFQVCRQMTGSQNTLTEVRLIAFIYSNWNILISNEDRKRELCLDWLLEPSFFEGHFNHWCPMVRAYYLRLLCWRVARYDGDATELDMAIYKALADRLNGSWASYLYLKNEAEGQDHPLPSSAPCSPAPGRRLIIIRSDSQPVPVSMFTSFDKVTSQMPSAHLNNSIPTLNGNIHTDSSRNPSKKRWSFMRNIMPFSSPVNTRPGEVTPPRSADESTVTDTDPTSTSDTLSIRSSATTAITITSASAEPSERRPPTPPHQPFSFKFSLEWLDRPNWPSKNRRLSPPKLPKPAQNLIQRPEEEGGQEIKHVEPRKPQPASVGNARYAGRALAEWAQIVGECQGFFERRKDEGVPTDRLVETPTLGVENFRMYG